MYTIEITPIAQEDIRSLRKYEQNIIIEAIETQLTYQPTIETTNRFRRYPIEIAEWELRVGSFRIFYNVEESVRIVRVERVGHKPNNTLFFRGKKEGRS